MRFLVISLIIGSFVIIPVTEASALTIKQILCYKDSTLCANGNVTLAFNVKNGTVSTLNLIGCANNQIMKWQSSNSSWVCGTDITGGGLITINGDITAAQILAGTTGNITLTDVGPTHTFNLGVNPVITGGSAQTVTKSLTLNGVTTLSHGINSIALSNLGLIIADPKDDYAVSLVPVAFHANQTLTLPNGTATLLSTNGNQGLKWGTKLCFDGSIDCSTSVNYIYANNQTNQLLFVGGNRLAINITSSRTVFPGNEDFGSGTDTFGGGAIIIRNAAATFADTIKGAAVTGNQTLTLPFGTNTLLSNSSKIMDLSDVGGQPAGALCSNNQILKFQTSNNTWTCQSDSGLTAAVTSINTDTTAAQTLTGQALNISATTSAGTTTFKLGSNVAVLGNLAQTFTKAITFSSGSVLTMTPSSSTGTFNLGTLSAYPTSPRQGILVINGSNLSYNDNSNNTRTVGLLNLAQTYKAKETYTPTASTAGLNLGTLSSYTTSPRQGDLIINGSTLSYQDNSNKTRTLAIYPSYNFTTPTNKTATSSGAAVMLGSFATLTTKVMKNATVNVSGDAYSNLANSGCFIGIRTSTSNMGLNGATLAGSAVGSTMVTTSATANANMTFSKTVIVTGLTAGTKNFFDLSYSRITSGSICKIHHLDWLVKEGE